MIEFNQVIEFSIKELREFCISQVNSEFAEYAEVLLAYMSGDADFFKGLSKISEEYSELVKLRRDIILGQVDFEKDFKTVLDRLDITLKGEYAFIVAQAYGKNDYHREAYDWYCLAYASLKKIGAFKKAVKTLLNLVATKSRIDAHKNYILDYQYVADQALEYDCKVVAGICLLNISVEQRKFGAYELSLESIHQALEYLKEDKGADHFFTALVHRCHLFIDLGNYQMAILDYQKVKMSNFPHIKEASVVIKQLLGDREQYTFDHLEPIWKERLISKNSTSAKIKLTKTEKLLISILSEKEQSKEDLIEQIYGEIDWEAGENRFRMLISRLNRKHKGIIIKSKDIFKIAGSKIVDFQRMTS